ncbi:MAG: MarR family transcriptional regulator [Pseudomonadota bacterium]
MPATPSDALLIEITNAFSAVQRQLGSALSIHGLGFSEYLVLWYLHNAPSNKLRRIDLADKVGLTASGITRVVNPMEKTGLVDKEQAARDARVSLVTLTTAGARVFDEASVGFRGTADRIVRQYGRRALEALVKS